jgi:hypothetical protein
MKKSHILEFSFTALRKVPFSKRDATQLVVNLKVSLEL